MIRSTAATRRSRISVRLAEPRSRVRIVCTHPVLERTPGTRPCRACGKPRTAPTTDLPLAA